jgi:hypothetical protein
MYRKKLESAWVTQEIIGFIDEAFWYKYINENIKEILQRLLKVKQLNAKPHFHSSTNISTKIWFSGKIVLETIRWNQFVHINPKRRWDSIVIDLFSRWNEEILTYRDKSWEYLINPKLLCSVDLFWWNKESDRACYRHICSEALLFISMLPDQSVNYILSWVDQHSISILWLQSEEEYYDLLNNNLYRTIERWGFILWTNYQFSKELSAFFSKGLAPEYTSDVYYFEK